ncbi:MAG: histidine kinase [Chloroflexota bacterium]
MLAGVRAWLANLGLQRRIQLLTVVGLLIVFVLFWLASQQVIEASTRQNLNQQLTVAQLVASSLDYRLKSALAILQETAQQPDLVSDNPLISHTTLLQEAQLQLSSVGLRLFWLTPDGQILWPESFDPTWPAGSCPDLPAARFAVEQKFWRVSNLCQNPNSKKPYILLVVPVSGASGKVDSLLAGEIDVDQLGLSEILSQVSLSDNTYLEVVDYAGNVLLSSSPEQNFKQVDHAEQFVRLIDNHQARVGQCHQCHAGNGADQIIRLDEVLAFAPLSQAAWGVAVRQPVSEARAPLEQLRRQLFIGGGIVLAAALLTTTWFIRQQIVGPIQALDQASEEWATGNLGVPTPHGGIDEVARLTANLELMRARLDATLEDHRRWNEALEEMVHERTHELAAMCEQIQDREAMCKRLLGKVLTTQEEERTRLARELHDAIGQSLTAVIMTTNVVEGSLPDSFVSGKEKLTTVRNIAAQALQDLRNLIFDLRPEVLDDLGLALALRSQVQKYLEPAGVQVRLRAAGLKDQLPAEVERAVFRVVQEAITNIARHARASEAHISLTIKDARLVVRVEDNGLGFDPDQVRTGQRQTWGLQGMEERITLLGGKFYIGSKPGSGTLVLAEVPLKQNETLPHRMIH